MHPGPAGSAAAGLRCGRRVAAAAAASDASGSRRTHQLRVRWRIGDLEDSILLWELPFRDVSKLDFDIT